MSKDNGIYILATKSPSDDTELQYRVIHAHAIDNIYGEMSLDGVPEPNSHMIEEYFGDCDPLSTEDDAIEKAMFLLEEYGTTEHGIGVIYAWEDKTYKELIGG